MIQLSGPSKPITQDEVAAENSGKNRRAKKPITHDEVAAENSGKAGLRRPAAREHGFRGIHRRTYGRWSAEIRNGITGCREWLGTYDTAELAARVYDNAARRIHGGKARTNFPLRQEEDATVAAAAAKKLKRAPAAEVVAPAAAAAAKKLKRAPTAEVVAPAAAAATVHNNDWPWDIDIETYVEPTAQLVTPVSGAVHDGTWVLEAYMKLLSLSEAELETWDFETYMKFLSEKVDENNGTWDFQACKKLLSEVELYDRAGQPLPRDLPHGAGDGYQN
ncbi:hypothetical protein ABZP36_010284 [Zizania latifolia]